MRTHRTIAASLFTLAALASACDDEGTGVAPPAAVEATTPTTQSGTAGAAVIAAPAVRVTDTRGRAAAGVTVAFAVTAGAGTLGSVSATTDANGAASAGTWVLGPGVGANTVTATVAGLGPVTFTAQAAAGPPATVVPHAGNEQTALAGRAVAVAPAVRVRDAFGNAVAGRPVTFTVASGGGSVTGSAATTDENGVAAVGSWALGAPGANTLQAWVGSLPPATLTAMAVDPCTVSTAYGFGATFSGELDALDCRLGSGQRVDFLNLAIGATQDFVIDLSAAFDPFLYLFDASGRAVAADDDGGPGTSARIHVIAPAGSYFIGASASPGAIGPTLLGGYTLNTGAAGGLTGCEQAWVLPGISTVQQLSTTDNCYGTFFFADRFFVELRAGQTVTIRQASSAFDTFLILYNPAGSFVAFNDDSDGTLNSRITYTAPAAGRYTIHASSFSGGATGSYTLTIQ